MTLNQFIDIGSDDYTLSLISKSLEPTVLKKALDKSKLVQVDVQYRTKNGKIATRKQWKSVGETDIKSSTKSVKREPLPATPHVLTEKTEHLMPWMVGEELPEHIDNLKKPIPPNWRFVRISPDPKSEVYVIGKDDMNRTQYIYNEEFVKQKTAEKFERVKELRQNKSKLIQVIQSLDDTDTSDCLNLILHMGIRPGSTRNTKARVEALGATTLKGENVVLENGQVYLRFIGKKGVKQEHIVPSKELSEMLLERKRKVPPDGDLFSTSDVKLRKALEPLGIHPKDLRTLLANEIAQRYLNDLQPVSDSKEFSKIRNQVGIVVSNILGNRREESLRSYIDPNIFRVWSKQGMQNWENETKSKSQKEGVA